MNKDENKKKKHSKDTPFNRVPKMTVFDKNLTVYDIAVLNSICSFINSKDDSWAMTRKDIAERAHMGTKDLHAVDKCIKKLAAGGYLNYVSGGEGVANKYTVKFPRVDAELYTKGKKDTPVPVSEPAADSNVIPITRKKLPKKILKAPANKQEPNNDIQYLISHWTMKATSHNMKYTPADKDAVAVSTLLDKHSPAELKALISFVWDVWEVPANKPNLKAEMDINILNTGYANSIINSYEQCKAGKRKPELPLREWREVAEKEKSLDSATNTNKRQSRIFV